MTEAVRTLLPCPFCGGEAVVWPVVKPTCFQVGCKHCGGRSDGYPESSEAIEAWNTRSPLPGTREEVAGADSEGVGAQLDAFERATEIMASWLARFRDETSEPTENDRLTAGHLAGALWANNLLAALPPAPMPERETDLQERLDEALKQLGIVSARFGAERERMREALIACREYLAEIIKPPRVGSFVGVISSYHPCHALIDKIRAALASHDDKGPAVSRAQSGGET